MKQCYLILSVVIFLVGFARGQDTLRLSLQEAMQKSITERKAYENVKLSEVAAHKMIQEAYIRLLPQATGTFDVRDYIKRPTSLVPGELAGLPPGTRIPVQFNTHYFIDANLSFTQPIIDFTAFNAIKQAKLNEDVAKLNAKDSADIMKLTVIQDYINALIQEKRVRQQAAAIRRYEQTAAYTVDRVTLGLMPEIDGLRAETNLDNARLEQEKLQEQEQLAKLLLKFHAGIPLTDPIALSDSLEQLTANEFPELQMGLVSAFRRQRMIVEQRRLQVNGQRASALPTLSAYALVGKQGISNTFAPFNNAKMPWFPVGYVGFTFRWNLTNLYTNLVAVPRTRIALMQAKNTLQELEQQLSYDYESAAVTARNADRDLEITRKKRTVAEENLEYLQERFKKGFVSVADLATAENDLVQASDDYFIALLNQQLAHYQLLKTAGKF